MKRLIPCLILVVPFLTSCDINDPEYYDAGYYHSVPPRAEIYGYDERPHDYRHPSRHHRGHNTTYVAPNQAKVHEHGNQEHGHKKHHEQVVVTDKNKNKDHKHDKVHMIKKKIGW
ncbi:Uncharacterised protein [Legionella steigerwaltii]|uniref:Lipoprotein n=1 Tax=Legionella steigerwaltii TaxID=460 RepID=A0A378LAF0_9GAMM|nr:hypothetical protein [Legionella steigerwaltii]KTD79085.1 hypothetical protein Lstg_1042 [Legionella steigerwaltii]STY23677.1 Uncharacterised protein [Legionella steigerwaltii]